MLPEISVPRSGNLPPMSTMPRGKAGIRTPPHLTTQYFLLLTHPLKRDYRNGTQQLDIAYITIVILIKAIFANQQ